MKKAGGVILIIFLIALGYIAYLFFKPHRDIQKTKAFRTIEATALVQEFLTNAREANLRYLDTEGESKVLIVTGTVVKTTTDQLGQKVLFLGTKKSDMFVSCTFSEENNNQTGDTIEVKGVIRSGAEYDEDLDLFEDVILEKCTLAPLKR